MASELLKELLAAGIHFGHRASRWNPKMKPYIFGKRNMIHIIDIKETLKGLLKAKKFLTQKVAEGGDVLFVGTKRQAKHAIEAHAKRANMHYVSERWLGGTLTNFRTIRSRLARLEELEKLEESGELANYSKKMIATLQREKKKIKRNLEGIRRMESMPAVMVIVDPRYEHIAIREAKKLDIPTISLIDTDADPDLTDIPIPGNDDSIRAIDVVLRELADAVIEGVKLRPEEQPAVSSGQNLDAEPADLREAKRRPRRRPPQRVAPKLQESAVPASPASSETQKQSTSAQGQQEAQANQTQQEAQQTQQPSENVSDASEADSASSAGSSQSSES